LKATKAYIASLGTTGVLLAASLLMLAVVSAVVAFDRWPGSNLQTQVKTLTLDDKAPAIRVSANASSRSASALARATTRTGGATSPQRVTLNGGGVGGQRVTAGRPTAGATVPAVTAPAAPPLVPKAPDVPTPDNIVNSISNPGTTASQIADGTQAVTDTAGRSLTTLNPDVGGTVTQAGQAVAETVRAAPLPDHVVPGH
jgi:hypothetical protein